MDDSRIHLAGHLGANFRSKEGWFHLLAVIIRGNKWRNLQFTKLNFFHRCVHHVRRQSKKGALGLKEKLEPHIISIKERRNNYVRTVILSLSYFTSENV